jgi:hypothetical protein
MSAKDLIRQRAFSSRNARNKIVKLKMDGEETEVLVRQPTLKQRSAIIEAMGELDKDGNTKSVAKAMEGKLLAILYCACDPESQPPFTPLFTAQDRENLLAQPAGGWLDELAGECLSMLQAEPKEQAKQVEETAKNSEATPSPT